MLINIVIQLSSLCHKLFYMYTYSHVWVIAVRLSSEDSFLLSEDLSERYPNQSSFESYASAEDDEPYIVAEISEQVYPMTFALGDNSSTFNISDFPNIYINGLLTEGKLYSVSVRFFSSSSTVSYSLICKQ